MLNSGDSDRPRDSPRRRHRETNEDTRPHQRTMRSVPTTPTQTRRPSYLELQSLDNTFIITTTKPAPIVEWSKEKRVLLPVPHLTRFDHAISSLDYCLCSNHRPPERILTSTRSHVSEMRSNKMRLVDWPLLLHASGGNYLSTRAISVACLFLCVCGRIASSRSGLGNVLLSDSLVR
uniref:Uncharacterized protein n=1 Tax=Timema bartmani TaxID=61472 RepID=A0A7R9EN70_9NEOP|nr:unnamed protein product [Timema bartmani]